MRIGPKKAKKLYKERILRYFRAAAITNIVTSSKVEGSSVTE